MLPPSHRLRRSADFTAVLRGGRRAGRPTVVVHVLAARSSPPPPGPAYSGPASTEPESSRFGLVVGRGVGNSVVRHRVSRRLRALLAQRVDRVGTGADVVVRALPQAASATSAQLGADLDSALTTLARRADRVPSGRAR